MERYINAGKLKAHYSWWENGSEEYREFKQIFDTIIDVQPTADVVERKKGKWIAVKIGNGDTRYTCSECGASYECDSRDAWDFNFCPNCGSEMKGEKNE